MDYFKLKFKLIIILFFLLILIISSCSNKKKIEDLMDVNTWNNSTLMHIEKRCVGVELLTLKLVPKLSYKNQTFESIKAYINHRLKFRNEIKSNLLKIRGVTNHDLIRIEEFYNNETEYVRLIFSSGSNGKAEIVSMKMANKEFIIEKTMVNDYIKNEFEDNCVIAKKEGIPTRFSVFTEIKADQKYETLYFSLY